MVYSRGLALAAMLAAPPPGAIRLRSQPYLPPDVAYLDGDIFGHPDMLDRIALSLDKTLVVRRGSGVPRVVVCDAAVGLEHAAGAGILGR